MKHYLKLVTQYICVLFVLCCFVSCQQEELEIPVENSAIEKGTIRNMVDAKDVPALQSFVANKMKGLPQKSSGSGTYVETSFGQIPLENITEVIDLDGNTNYTFKIYPNNPEPNTFYNLIVNPSVDGDELVAFVLEYKMTEELANGLFFGQKTMDSFDGTINKYSLDTFLNSGIAKSADLPCPCSEVNVYNDNSLGGTGGGSGSGDSGDSDSTGDDGGDPYDNGSSTGGTNAGGGGCRIRLVIECRGSRDLPPWWPQGSNCITTGIIIDCPANKSGIAKTSDCPISDTGDCPINNGEFGVDDYQLVEFLNITDRNLRMQLLFDANQDLVNASGNFLWIFKDNPEQLETAKASTIEILNQFVNDVITKQDAIKLLESTENIETVKVFSEIGNALGQELINEDQANALFILLGTNEKILETINFSRYTLEVLQSGTLQQKRFVNAVLSSNISEALNIALEGSAYQQCCNDEFPNDISTKMAYFTASIAINFYDGMFNLVKMVEDLFYSDEEEGRFVRIIAENSGLDISSSISNETLGRLFKVRYQHQGEMHVVPAGEWYQAYLDAAITFVDIFGVLTPSSNGGAFLAIRGGGTITAQVLSDYLKVIGKGSWKTVNESMSDAAKSYQELISGKPWNQSFEMPGPVKFDGIKNAVFQEAKSGMLNFVDANGQFKPFFNGQEAIINQARRQRQVADDLPIEWHFEHDLVRQAFESLLSLENLNIKFIHTPR
ncbi:Tox-REase-5 domain-containing protein [Aquimarina sp. SS2-1]|uniref:Tox-REase-5 domain-containing protein n=1 Tax=Aquimarina besae TaxID=3342247 RepID=UPI00366B330F